MKLPYFRNVRVLIPLAGTSFSIKLLRYGLGGVAFFSKSYFRQRKQFVSFKGFQSMTLEQSIGVIQVLKLYPYSTMFHQIILASFWKETNILGLLATLV